MSRENDIDPMQDMDALVCRRTLTGHTHDVLSITGLDYSSHFQPSNSTIAGPPETLLPRSSSNVFQTLALYASASADETVRIWDAKDWTCLRVIVCEDSNPDLSSQAFLSVLMSQR